MPIVDVVGRADSSRPGPASATVASSSSATSEQAAVLTGTEPAQDMASRIQQLRGSQMRLREQKHKISKELKAAIRKSKRLKERARHLSEEDMLHILVMKRSKQATTAGPDTSAASSSGLSSASGSGCGTTAGIDVVAMSALSTARMPSPDVDEDVGPE